MPTQKKRFGKLRALTSLDATTVAVRCECGRELEVTKHALLRGDHKSCGQGACKAYARAEYDPKFQPRRPRAMTVAQVRRAWAFYHHKNPDKRLSVEQLAVKHEVPYTTLCGIFNSVRKSGGIERYEELLS